jgi:hypothetical protein
VDATCQIRTNPVSDAHEAQKAQRAAHALRAMPCRAQESRRPRRRTVAYAIRRIRSRCSVAMFATETSAWGFSMKNIVIALAGVFLLASGAAWSSDEAKTSSTSSKTDTATKSDTSSSSSEVTGTVQSADAKGHALSIQAKDGSVQHLTVASDATVTRDGSSSSFSDIKEGDRVRASLDASSNKAKQIEVKSKDKDTSTKSK